jgi:intein/homing endonuclease
MTERLNIQLYENPVAACLAGQVRGSFPSFIPKTDQERCLSGNTLVNTDKGLKTIKEVCENYKDVKVLSYNESEEIEEYKEVEEVSILNNNNDWYEVKTELGKCINITSNHPVFLPILCCYRKVEDLKVGDYLLDKTE